jgi:hypothetical protein
MDPTRLILENIGQIKKADIPFGDLTVLVGPQATGKSIALQFLKLLVDDAPIRRRLDQYGVDWERKLLPFFEVYFGEGMQSLWRVESRLFVDGAPVDLAKHIKRPIPKPQEPTLFYVPAQRVMTLRDGWPRPFSDYGPSDPFCVRDFSDELRVLMGSDFARQETLFPKSNRLKEPIRAVLDDAVFHGYGLHVDKARPQRRLVLGGTAEGGGLPFMVWSAGQREFVPLLLGLYWLMPGAKVKRRGMLQWVVIEEPEMGLHPKAINATMLLVFELLWRGYKVCLSTHSPQVLDIVWAVQAIRDHNGTAVDVLELFDCKHTPPMEEVTAAALGKRYSVVYFDQATGSTQDITKLDPGSDDEAESGWGGLTGFSGRVGNIVARVVANVTGFHIDRVAEDGPR